MQEKVNNMRIPYGKSVHGNSEIKAVLQVLKNSTQMGYNVKTLEKKICKMFSKKYGIMFNSGTSALYLLFEILNLPKNSEIITPALNFGTAVASIVKNNYKPVFVDVKNNTFCVDETKIEKLINKRTKALLIPNLLGNLPNWLELNKIAKKYNILLIEDSADTLGATFNKKSSGFYSDYSITSFYGSHVINGAGNGGMLCLNKKNEYLKILTLRSWGRSSSIFKDSENINKRLEKKISNIQYDAKFIFSEMGYNLEPSEISAAFALEQLKKIKYFENQRNMNFKKLYNFFSKYNDFFLLPHQDKKVTTSWLAFPIVIKKNKFFKRKDLQLFLEKNQIQTRVIMTGNILRQPGFKKLADKNKNNPKIFKNADFVMIGGMLLGCHQGIKNKEINYLISKLELFLRKFI